SHHERYDGTGYPDRLKGDESPLAAQIVGILDVYDALTTARVYQAARTRDQALAELTRYRSWWSDRVFEAFLNAIPHLPAKRARCSAVAAGSASRTSAQASPSIGPMVTAASSIRSARAGEP